MTENSQDELPKRANNLFNALQKNPKSIFYLTGNATSKTLFNKAAKSAFEKGRVFVNLYNQLQNKKKFKKLNQDSLPITTPFYDFKSNVDHSTL